MTADLEIDGLKFQIRRSQRRKTLGLTVDRDGRLLVHVPEQSTISELDRWIRSKLLWVHQKLALKEDLNPVCHEPEFVTGESFSYLGHKYQLRLVRSQAAALEFDGHRFTLRRDARSQAATHFQRWYVQTGTEWLKARTKLFVRRIGVQPSRIYVRNLGFRWGSCTRTGTIHFNWRLLQLPVRLADYVIAHELAHLKEHNHGPAFWKALELAMPDCHQRRSELAAKSASYLVFGMSVVPAGSS